MMERVMKLHKTLLFCLIALPGLGHANGWGIGIDVVRLIDGNQDDGMFNIFAQAPVAPSGAVVVGHAKGDNLTIIEGGYKHYLGSRLDSAFFQVGLGYYDIDVDDDVGFIGHAGFEKRVARHIVVTGSVKMIAGIDETIIGYPETPVFQPTLGVMLAF